MAIYISYNNDSLSNISTQRPPKGLVQAAGVSQSVPNPDGDYPDASRDFWAQGVSNIVAGTFRGLPLGGSLGGTGIILSTGAKSRFANVFLGGFVAIFVLLFARYVDMVAMPAIAGVLIVVGIQIINTEEISDIWDVHTSKRVIMIVTFLATLILPIAQAILLGVLLSFIDYAYASSRNVGLTAISLSDEGQLVEGPVPERLPDNSITILYVRGSYYFAAVRTIQEYLPSAKDSKNAVVILRMRGMEEIGSTFILALERYAGEVKAGGGKLLLSGLHESVREQLRRTETTDDIPEDSLFIATDTIGKSTSEAMVAAQSHIAQQSSHTETPSQES